MTPYRKMVKQLLILTVLLTGCTSNPYIAPPTIRAKVAQPLTIPAGATHLKFSAGKIGKAGRYQPYCRLDVKAPLEGEKQIQAGIYIGSKIYQRIVRDDLTQHPAFFSFYTFGFLDAENVFNLFSVNLNGEANEGLQLRCFQEFQSRFEVRPFLLQDINAIVDPYLRLSPAE